VGIIFFNIFLHQCSIQRNIIQSKTRHFE